MSRARRSSVAWTTRGSANNDSAKPPPFSRTKQMATVPLQGQPTMIDAEGHLSTTPTSMASIAGELCLLTTNRKLIPVKAKVLSHCDLGSAYAGRQMLPVPIGCPQNGVQMALQVDEESRLVEKLLALLELDADDASGQQLQARLLDSRGVLKRGLEPWLFPLLSVADRWGARHLRDLLVSVFVDNFERILQPTPGHHMNPFASLSGGVLKALLLPLVQRASGEQLKRVLDLLRECQSNAQSVHGSHILAAGARCACISRRDCSHGGGGGGDGLHADGLRELSGGFCTGGNNSGYMMIGPCGDKGKRDRLRRVDRLRVDRSAQDALALRKVTNLIEDRLEELCSH